ncbi:MAG: AraC family transcriptional regulator [Tannerellaceae bacterium]|jgi:AraC-like DNA-binding protein|nr:AraC family transcriptional regulator [Tannerellaceae bacterium]
MKQVDLKEQTAKKHTLSDFNIEFYFKHEKKDKTIQIKDKHLNHILFMLEGEVNVSYNEFRNHLCKAGEMIFIPQNSTIAIESFSEVTYLLLSFNNHIVLYEEFEWGELKGFDGERDIFHKLDIRQPLQDILESIVFYKNNKIESIHLSEVKEKEIFLMMKNAYSKQEIARFIKPLLRQDLDFKAFVINHYIKAKSVDDLASMCNLSIRAFTRKFKTNFDDSPYRWILRQKSNQIKILLANKKIPMQAIIKEYGFSSPAHFTTYCKKQFGQTPSMFRNSLNGKHESAANIEMAEQTVESKRKK